jgi:ribosomal protein S18 acetylase RimI-like enzyme
MMGPTLQLAKLADVDALLEMMAQFNDLEAIPWTRHEARPAVEKLVVSPQLGLVGLVVEGDTVRGYFVVTWGYDLEWYGRDAFLTELYLLPEARGRGLGREVMAQVEALASQRGARALHLVVRPENTAAVRLYESAGFERPPRVLMSKGLTAG